MDFFLSMRSLRALSCGSADGIHPTSGALTGRMLYVRALEVTVLSKVSHPLYAGALQHCAAFENRGLRQAAQQKTTRPLHPSALQLQCPLGWRLVPTRTGVPGGSSFEGDLSNKPLDGGSVGTLFSLIIP